MTGLRREGGARVVGAGPRRAAVRTRAQAAPPYEP